MNRPQRGVQQDFDPSPTIRRFTRNGFSALNISRTPEALEIYAFAPGVDPSTLEVDGRAVHAC